MPANLGLALPIASVDSLGEGTEFGEGWRLSDAGEFILDAVGKAVVEVVPEGTFSVTSDLRGDPIKLHNVLIDTLSILHRQMVELVFRISDGVVRTEVGFELVDELLEVVHPDRTECGVFHEEEVRFEPFQRDALQVRLREGDFSAVGAECLRAILEVKFALHQEDPELAGICPVKLIRFSDLGALIGFGGSPTRGASEAADGTSKLGERVSGNLLVVLVGVGMGVGEEWTVGVVIGVVSR